MLLPDDLVLPAGVLSRMAEVRNRYGGSVLCAFDIPREEISAYGVFDVSDTDDADVKQVHGMVEKPPPTRRRPRSPRRAATSSTSRSSTRWTGSPRARVASCSSPTPSSC